MKHNVLSNLITISHAVGEHLELIQGGGGNTSVKSHDGTMFIKASGTPLKGMTENIGYAIIDMRTLRVIGPHPSVRPSMELPMHLQLPRYVIHTHAVYPNVFNCMRHGHDELQAVFKDFHALFIPYATPGQNLAQAINKHVERFREEHHIDPNILFLQNHGLITCDDNVTTALRLTTHVSEMVWNTLIERLPTLMPFQMGNVAHMPPVQDYLFPDAAVFAGHENITQGAREIIAANAYVADVISQLGGHAQPLAPLEIQHLQTMESEQYRQHVINS